MGKLDLPFFWILLVSFCLHGLSSVCQKEPSLYEVPFHNILECLYRSALNKQKSPLLSKVLPAYPLNAQYSLAVANADMRIHWRGKVGNRSEDRFHRGDLD